MGVVVHVELVIGSVATLQEAINERLTLMPSFGLPLGVIAYPGDVDIEAGAGEDWVATISYECDGDDAEDLDEVAYEQVDDTEAKYVPPGSQGDAAMAVGTQVRDVHTPRVDWNA